jgi:hypothetical protein
MDEYIAIVYVLLELCLVLSVGIRFLKSELTTIFVIRAGLAVVIAKRHASTQKHIPLITLVVSTVLIA